MRTEDLLVLGRIWLQQSDATVAKHLGDPGKVLTIFGCSHCTQCAETPASPERIAKII